MTDPALMQWMDEHRQHACALLHQLIGVLRHLPNHDRHSLERAVAERVALGHAAAETAQHLASVHLGDTAEWRPYLTLGDGVSEEVASWRRTYASHGADALRAATVPDLERTAAFLEHPLPLAGHDSRSHDSVLWLPYTNREVEQLYEQAREAVNALDQHPHDQAALAAVREAWSALTESVGHTADRLARVNDHQLDDSIGSSYRIKHVRNFTIPATLNAYRDLHSLLIAPEAQHAAQEGVPHPLHEALHHGAYYLTEILAYCP